MQKTTHKKEYDMAMKSKALTGLLLRVAVSGYIVYLAWKILSGMINGASPIPVWAVWLFCIVLTTVALGFCLYSWKAYQIALKAAEISAVPEPVRIDCISEAKDSDWKADAYKDNEASDPEDM